MIGSIICIKNHAFSRPRQKILVRRRGNMTERGAWSERMGRGDRKTGEDVQRETGRYRQTERE